MNKTKKLLSVLLAVIMALSCMSVMASAVGKTSYQTVDNLKALDAYSPYGQVTRLNTEERMSITLDFLDNMLAGLNMAPMNLDITIAKITVNLQSVNGLCSTVDSVNTALNSGFSGFLVGIVGGLLGIIADLDFSTWQSGMTRENQNQLTIIRELLELLDANKGVLQNVVSTGKLDLGSIIGGLVDLSAVTDIIGDIPGMIKGLVWGLFERWDDTLVEIQAYDSSSTGNGQIESTLNTFVKNLFNNNMSITTLKYDDEGKMISEHTGWNSTATGSAAPTATNSSMRYYYQFSSTTPGSTMQSYHIVDAAEAKALAKDTDPDNDVAAYNYVKENQIYVMEAEVEGGDTYVWKAYEVDEEGNIVTDSKGEKKYLGTLKYYNDDSQFLKGFDGNSIDLSTMSAGTLLYTFIPSVFSNLATVVLNGSVKKILAEFFGAKFTFVGNAGPEADEAVAALGTDDIFVGEQGDYVFEWSDYAIIDGVHYYRFEDQLFVGDISNTNNYFDIINWNFEITDDFMNQFIPADDTDVNTRLLNNFNDFLVKVAETVTVASATTVNKADGTTKEWVRPTFTSGNANIVANLKAAAQAVIKLAPEHIFGSNYETNEHCYYDMLISTNDETILAGIAAQLVDIIMPSMTLPTAEELMNANAKVGAILAAVVREFAAQLIPEFNYDALIYADFGTTTADPVKTFLSGKDNNYWLDVILTMGVDIGFEYLRAFADMGEDSDLWNSFVAYSGYGVDGKTYAAGTSAETLRNQWEGMLDYVIDWALFDGYVTETVETPTYDDCGKQTGTTTTTTRVLKYEWTWKMANLVDVSGLTIDLATKQDPWEKLQKVLGSILPVDEILTVSTTSEYPTKMEKFLRYDLILGLLELRWADLINTVQFSGSHFRTDNVLDQLADLIKGIVNSLFKKVGGGSYELLPSVMTDIDSLANQSNLGVLVGGLLGALKVAGNDPDGSKGGLLDTVLPIVGMFLGWKTDPQVMADPIMGYSFRDGNDYAFQWIDNGVYPSIDSENTKITFLNNSSGMLETHRDSNVVDNEYAIQIKNITSDATTNTLTFSYGDGYVSPYETLEIKIGGTYVGEESTTITIAYDFVGKDGKAVGGTQYTSTTILFSNQYEDSLVEGRESGDDKDGKNGIDPWKKYQFTTDIYTTVTEFEPSIWSTNETGSGTSNYKSTTAPDNGIDMNELASTYFAYYQNRDGGWGSSFAKDGATSGKLYYAKDGVTADTEFPYGTYDMGRVAVKYSDDSKVWEIDYIYYTDYGIYDLYTANKDNGYHANMGVDPAIYNEYNEAWKLIVYGATYPMMTEANGNAATDYVKTIMPYIPDAMDRFEAAKEAMDEALAEVQASGAAAAALPSHVQSLYDYLATDDKALNGFEVNFQDYEYYEYFAYADLRTVARNTYASYTVPAVMDTYYILNSGISEAELDNVIAAEANATKAAAITASRLENDPAAIAASIEARENWVMPAHTKLYIEDMEARLRFYKQFLTGHEEAPDHKKFLELEIAHVEAQGFKEADYEAVTWGRYADALATAKAVVAGTDEYAGYNSRIFDAKWELMTARKQLLKKADSLIEAGGTAKLIETITLAEEILAMNLDDIRLSQVAIDKNLTKEQALGHLIQGLGYYYVGEDGNTWNLYADSAYEYRDNDRPNNSGNQAKVNAANANLEACIAYFATEEAEPPTLEVKPSDEFEYADYVVLDKVNTNYDEFTGVIYGIDTLDQNDMMEQLAALGDALKASTNEDTHIVIEANDMGMESTGAMIYIVDSDENVLETYVFVYFGDIDGDGMISSNDALIAEWYEIAYEGIESYAAYVAADLDGDGMPSANDALMAEWYEIAYEGIDYQYNLGQNAMNNVYEWIF